MPVRAGGKSGRFIVKDIDLKRRGACRSWFRAWELNSSAGEGSEAETPSGEVRVWAEPPVEVREATVPLSFTGWRPGSEHAGLELSRSLSSEAKPRKIECVTLQGSGRRGDFFLFHG